MATASPDTSASLLQRAGVAGDADAWKALVEMYTPLLQVWLTSAGLQSADRDDITQRVFEILIRRLPEFQHCGRTGAFRAWLRGIITNLLREFWRDRPSRLHDRLVFKRPMPEGPWEKLLLYP